MGWHRARAPAEPPAENREPPGGDAPRSLATAGGGGEIVLGVLRGWISDNSELPLTVDQIDVDANLCDAGYIDSIKSAEFLVLIGERYGVFIPEADLVGKLSSLKSIVGHILASARGEDSE